MEVRFIDKEISLADVSFEREQSFSSVNKKNVDMIVKMTSKFWTDVASGMIEGESMIQVLKDGTRLGKSDTLEYELKEAFKFENILTKEGRLKQRKVMVKKQVPVVR